MDKKTLRKEIREKLQQLSSEYKKASSAAISDFFLSSEDYEKAENIFVFVSTENEPDTAKIIQRALEDNKNVFVPKCLSKGNMIAVRITAGTRLSAGYMGIPEPEAFSEEKDISIDTAVIPCMSAYYDGKRLGHGAGFYDIFLKKHNPKKICLCFDKIVSPDIPMEENDIFMDEVITEKGIFIR